MIIAAEYSFKNGKEHIEMQHPKLLEEIHSILASVNAASYKTKISKEATMVGKTLFNPGEMNTAIKEEFIARSWETNKRIVCNYPTKYYTSSYIPKPLRPAFREMDYIKEQLGVEVQLGKYAFMVYNVCAKMTIFRNHGYIGAGVEIVPVKRLADEMSTGVSYFEQFVWDLEKRGVADIDIPVTDIWHTSLNL